MLPVSAPFHCLLMKPAAERLAAYLAKLVIDPAVVPVLHNADAREARTPDAIRVALAAQAASPVRWVETIRLFAARGATRGIGRAIALALARAGARVVGTATRDEGAEAITAYFKAEGCSGEGIRLDVAQGAAVEMAVAGIAERLGSIAILVNNAGITKDNLLLRMKEEEWDAIMDVNLKAAYRLSKAVLRGMIKARHGRIINIGSVVGASGNAGQANYAAAKAALIGFTKSLAQEVGGRSITVNCVAPGFIDTDMTRALSTAQREQLIARIPLGRLGLPEDIAHAVAFLASREAGYITGATLHVNGGMYMA
jgi:3-oxoacyl-[acyl-carrier protein] reductase